MRGIMRPKPVIVLEALCMGLPVEMGGLVLRMEDRQVCCEATRIDLRSGQETPVLLTAGMELDTFLRLADSISDEQAALLTASMAFNHILRPKGIERCIN